MDIIICSSASLSRTYKNHQRDPTSQAANLLSIQSLIPWLNDTTSHSFDTLIQAPDSLEVDPGVERVAGN